ncbi:hypothetical protein ACGF0J_21785 [Nonomuraea sp. NPDC047897]|uniref:hypothetical protein n=1 Tax=Nonomuraea sp. NPDC047897 TaxID=3364346 RepID=UPI00371F81DB
MRADVLDPTELTDEARRSPLARIRSVKPEFWSDRKLARQHSRDARMLYMALWNQADEHGRVLGDARWIKGNCMPYEDDIDPDGIERLLGELIASGRVQRYVVDDDPYLFLPKLAKHQRLEAAKVPSRLPPPPAEIVGPEDTPPEPRADVSEHDANESARRADQPARDAERSSLSYVAGSRGQVAGSREQESPVAVGQESNPYARTREAPAAQPEIFIARSIVASIPRYRAAPGWVKSKHLAPMAATALAAGFGRDAIVRYAGLVIDSGRFADHQHIPELRDALRRLALDVRTGHACAVCARDPDGTWCCVTEDRAWTEEDQAALERTLDQLGATPDELAQEA